MTGTVSDDMACFRLATEPGEGGYVKWPEGYYAIDDPLWILDPDGDVVGESGEPIQLGGGQFEAAGECGGVPYDRVWLASV